MNTNDLDQAITDIRRTLVVLADGDDGDVRVAEVPLHETDEINDWRNDAEFIAHAPQDVELLLAEIDRLREQLYAQKPVIDAAEAWAELLETDGSARDLASKLIDVHQAVEQYRLMDLALTTARNEQPVEVTR